MIYFEFQFSTTCAYIPQFTFGLTLMCYLWVVLGLVCHVKSGWFSRIIAGDVAGNIIFLLSSDKECNCLYFFYSESPTFFFFWGSGNYDSSSDFDCYECLLFMSSLLFAKPWHLTVFVTTNTWLSAAISGRQ